MKLLSDVRAFNTGRHYSTDGQPISWLLVEHDGKRFVAFVDHARMIDGVIPVYFGNLDIISHDWVLASYDGYHYTGNYAVMSFARAVIQAHSESIKSRCVQHVNDMGGYHMVSDWTDGSTVVSFECGRKL